MSESNDGIVPVWARNTNRWHDEVGPYHLRNPDLSPACGAKYFASNGPPPWPVDSHEKCRNCLRVEASRTLKSASSPSPSEKKQNREKMTWEEWARAAGLSEDAVNQRVLQILPYLAWVGGEDPAEWRVKEASVPEWGEGAPFPN